VVGQKVHDSLGNRDELCIAAGTREAERLDALAPLRLAAPAAAAAVTDDEPLADDAVAHVNGLDARPGLDDGAGPFVAGNHRKAHPAGIGEDACHHLDVRSAQPRLAAPNEYLAGSDGGRRDLAIGDLVGRLDDYRPHARIMLER